MQHQLLDLGLVPIGSTFRPTSEAYIAAVEATIGTALPPAYRSFLARFGVATFTDSVAAHLADGSWVDVQAFLGNDPDDSYDLKQSILSMREQQGPELVPVATDPIGNAFCLTLGPPSPFAVRYIDMNTDAAPWVADDFVAFLTGLRRVP